MLDVIMPQLGETVTEGTVTGWYKKIGDAVKKDEPLFDVETEKVTTEIPAPMNGVLTEILVETGVAVPVGTRLAVIEAGAAGTTKAPAAAAKPAPPAAEAPADPERIPHSRIRTQTAAHMTRSLATSAHVLQAMEVDYDRVEQARRQSKEGAALTYLPFIARAVCRAIAQFPYVNAHFAADALIVHKRVHLGIAVDLDFKGLVVPVVRNAHEKSVAALAREIRRLAAAARADALKPDEVTGATYTLSNSGAFGTFLTGSIISQPQVAILSTDGVKKRPVVIESPAGDQIAIRPVGMLAHSFDHRAFDGAYSAAFLRRVKDILETTDWSNET